MGVGGMGLKKKWRNPSGLSLGCCTIQSLLCSELLRACVYVAGLCSIDGSFH